MQLQIGLNMSDILLAIDTCSQRASIALRDKTTLRAECTWECKGAETATVAAKIDELMRSCDISAEQLGAVAVAIGPGSFTGVRCGLAIAKGICVSRKLPIVGVTAFDVIAYAQPQTNSTILAVVNAGRKRVAACPYEWHSGQLLSGEWKLQSWSELRDSIYEPTWVCGDLHDEFVAMLNKHARVAPAPLNMRRAGYLAEIAYRRWQKGEIDDVMTLTAIYPQPA
jgi:tRNA threonylcarbamoyladenosine biosynthesis protein TsaB